MNKLIKKLTIMGILLITIFIVVGCVYVNNSETYTPSDDYEKQTIELVKYNQDAAVTLYADNALVGSAVIYKADTANPLRTTYYVISAYQNLKAYLDKLVIYLPDIQQTIKPSAYLFDETMDFIIFTFTVGQSFGSAKTENKVMPVVGQSVIALSTPIDSSTSKHAFMGIVAHQQGSYFYFDASMNVSDIGAPIFNLEGDLIGIYTGKIDEVEYDDEAVNAEGLNKALNFADIYDYAIQLKVSHFNNQAVTATKSSDIVTYDANSPYEKQTIETAKSIQDVSVGIYVNDVLISSGVVVKHFDKGTLNGYYILSNYISFNAQNVAKTRILYQGEMLNVNRHFYSFKLGFSLWYIETSRVLNVAKTNAVTPVHGQNVVTSSYVEGIDINYVTSGVVSKTTYPYREVTNLGMMIDAPTNPSQLGGGVFANDGQLLGIMAEKEYTQLTTTGEMVSEGIVKVIRFDQIALVLDVNPNTVISNLDLSLPNYVKDTTAYQATTNTEKKAIEMIKEATQSVVSIKATGHGSGTIIKKQNNQDGTFTYSVITNHHVLSEADEATIILSDGITAYPVKDVYSLNLYDIGIARFVTSDVLPVKQTSQIDQSKGIEPSKGQIVYAIGTPADTAYFNYVTRGIISQNVRLYNAIYNLALMIDAPINPGNSGGALVDLQGNLIGVNVAKTISTQSIHGVYDAYGLGFTLNMNVVGPVVTTFKEENFTELVRKPRLGISIVSIEDYLKQYDASNLPANPKGVVVIDVDLTRDAYGKLLPHDLITHINGIQVVDSSTIANQLNKNEDGKAHFGDEHVITVVRKTDQGFESFEYTIILK